MQVVGRQAHNVHLNLHHAILSCPVHLYTLHPNKVQKL